MLKSNRGRLLVLTLVHFSADFYAGLRAPLPQPTLTEHLGVDFSTVMYLIYGFSFLVNITQPTFGAFMARKGFPLVLLFGVPMAAFLSMLGLTQSLLGVALIFAVAAIGIGIIHPEAAMITHAISGSRKGLSMSIFVSGGYFGYSCGNLVAGLWAQRWGLEYFWLLSIPGFLIIIPVLASGLHHFNAHPLEQAEDKLENSHSLWPVLALSSSLAVNVSLQVSFLTPVLVEKLGAEAQVWGGISLFCFGLCGALGSYFWAYLSERRSRPAIIAVATTLALPCFYFLQQVSSLSQIWMVPLLMAGMGLTMNACFPLNIVHAQAARQYSRRFRTGLVIGGSWCVGSIVGMLASYLCNFYQIEIVFFRTSSVLFVFSICIAVFMYFFNHKNLKVAEANNC